MMDALLMLEAPMLDEIFGPETYDNSAKEGGLFLAIIWRVLAFVAGAILLLAGVLVSLQQNCDWSQYVCLWMWGGGVLGVGCLMPWVATIIWHSDEMEDILRHSEGKLIKPVRSLLPPSFQGIAIVITLVCAVFRLSQVILWIHEGSPYKQFIRTALISDVLQTCLEYVQFGMVCISGAIINVPFFEFMYNVSEARVFSYIEQIGIPDPKAARQRRDPSQNHWDGLTSDYMELRKDLLRFWQASAGGMYVLLPCVLLSLIGGFCGVNILLCPDSKDQYTVAMAIPLLCVAFLIYPLSLISQMCLSRSLPGHSCIWTNLEVWGGKAMPGDDKLSQMRLLQRVEAHRIGVEISGLLITRELVLQLTYNFVVKLPAVLNITRRILSSD